MKRIVFAVLFMTSCSIFSTSIFDNEQEEVIIKAIMYDNANQYQVSNIDPTYDVRILNENVILNNRQKIQEYYSELVEHDSLKCETYLWPRKCELPALENYHSYTVYSECIKYFHDSTYDYYYPNKSRKVPALFIFNESGYLYDFYHNFDSTLKIFYKNEIGSFNSCKEAYDFSKFLFIYERLGVIVDSSWVWEDIVSPGVYLPFVFESENYFLVRYNALFYSSQIKAIYTFKYYKNGQMEYSFEADYDYMDGLYYDYEGSNSYTNDSLERAKFYNID
jgi:hypothetical protein